MPAGWNGLGLVVTDQLRRPPAQIAAAFQSNHSTTTLMTPGHFQCGHCGRQDEDAFPAVVCKHLLAEPRQFWHAHPPSIDGDEVDWWPDAHCPQCEEELARDGGWPGRRRAIEAMSDGKKRLALLQKAVENDRPICSDCYEACMASSMEASERPVRDEWEEFIEDCREVFMERQTGLMAEFALADYPQFDFDQMTGQPTLSGAHGSRVMADSEVIGSYATKDGRWLWAWGNPRFHEATRSPITKVQRFGELATYPRLTIRSWPASEEEALTMAAVATFILDAKGVYVLDGQNGPIYLAIMDIRRLPASH